MGSGGGEAVRNLLEALSVFAWESHVFTPPHSQTRVKLQGGDAGRAPLSRRARAVLERHSSTSTRLRTRHHGQIEKDQAQERRQQGT